MEKLIKQDEDRLLSAMQFRDYIWPNNPTTFETIFNKASVSHHYPFTNFVEIEILGITREFTGEGEFVGTGAYEEFGNMVNKCFYGRKAGILKHPTLVPTTAKMTELRLMQDPTPNYVKYSFKFLEEKVPVATATNIVAPKKDNIVDEAVNLMENTKENVQPDLKIEYKIKQGDTLSKISREYKTSIDEILKLNPGIKNPNLIITGNTLSIPVKGK